MSMQTLRNVARRCRRLLSETQVRTLRRLGFWPADWKTGLPEEFKFWENALRDPERCWVLQAYQDRLNPDLELQPELQALIPASPGAAVRLLDVGAGPLTDLGKKWSDRQVQIVPVDPLADEFNKLLAELGLCPPVSTLVGYGEKLLGQFKENEFDLAYTHNALDHSLDPLQSIRQMLAVTKPSCYVYLWHFANEGLTERYHGMHQWNFEVHKGDFLISNGRRTVWLNRELQGTIDLTCEATFAYGKRVVIAKIRKRPAA